MAQPKDRLAVRHREAAKMLGISERTLYEWVRLGRIRCKKVGRSALYAIADLEAFLGGTQAQGGEHGISQQ